MIRTHEKIRIADENKEYDLEFEVNWNQGDPESNECKLVRVIYPNGTVAIIKRDQLHAFLFAIGTADQQREMLPVKKTRSKWYETTISVKAKKDIAKGEEITFPLKLTIPMEESEGLQT